LALASSLSDVQRRLGYGRGWTKRDADGSPPAHAQGTASGSHAGKAIRSDVHSAEDDGLSESNAILPNFLAWSEEGRQVSAS
jgi:hypothetical protein